MKCDYLKEGKLEDHIKEYDLIIITEIIELGNIIKLAHICHINKKEPIYSLIFGL